MAIPPRAPATPAAPRRGLGVPLLASVAAHGGALLLLLGAAALWPGKPPSIPIVLAEVELVVQKTPSVGPQPAPPRSPPRQAAPAPVSPAPGRVTKTKPAVAADLPIPPPLPARIPPPSAAPPRVRPPTPAPAPSPTPVSSAPLPAPAGNAAPASSGMGLASGPEIIPAALDRRVRNIPPPYPRRAVRRGEEGSVLLEVAVRPDGSAKSVRVMESSGYPLLDRAARRAVRAWHFIAARRGGSPIASTMRLRIRFKLKNPP